ncbi:hypothetical protein B6U66_04590 [Candidatus Bathyarchaeota archaeon ex4484_135]|nr:MAG: hypothetical protein B6U66_04590 [Candidatus Bathyarchaeota archaeon ex4484_135]
MFIKEVILENFMSHKYSRIPLGPGINVICGPNGAGKSSILLGISLALGQSHTERSRRLRDLIRWGEEYARVTLILDNSPRKGRRPIPRVKKDYIVLTRVLRSDGRYWFELDGVAATREEIRRLLAKLGVDPENMLIIMHQGMVERFAALGPQQRLLLMEEAAGLADFRRRVLSAKKKLEKALSEEKAIKELLENARQTLEYWREQYERYQEKKQLTMRKEFLERELAWARVSEVETDIAKIEEGLKANRSELSEAESELSVLEDRIKKLSARLAELREVARRKMEEAFEERARSAKVELLLKLSANPGIEGSFWEAIAAELGFKPGSSVDLRAELARLLEESSEKARRAFSKALELEAEAFSLSDRLVEARVRSEVLRFKREQLLSAIRDLEAELRLKKAKLRDLLARAEALGPRIPVSRSSREVEEEFRHVEGQLLAYRDVTEEVERMYERYSKLYDELAEKARRARENREKAMEEVRKRMEAWRSVVGKMVDDVDARFRAILSRLQGDGSVILVNADDIEEAGIEIKVGFRGAKPVPLDVYTQSGGERSVATVAFLLALQQHVKSPFRAIDEYDVHLDPVNRQRLAEAFLSAVESSGVQYVVITPGPLPFKGHDVRILTVQAVEGESVVKILRP